MKPAQFNEQKPVARIVEHGATVKLEWASSDAAHNAKVGNLYTTPPQRKPLSEAQLEKGRDQTFSINNPFCPCDSKTFRKVARWVEAAHDIKE